MDLDRYWADWSRRATARAAPGWTDLVDDFRGLQDAFAGAVPTEETVAEVRDLLARCRELLDGHRAPTEHQIYGRLLRERGRGQTLVPPLRIEVVQDAELTGTTQFGPFHAGHNGAVHGGAIAMVFDEALGNAAHLSGSARMRTAYLHIDYRSVAPLETPLQVRSWLVESAGRKRHVRGSLHDGERLCAEAEALFLTLLPDQP